MASWAQRECDASLELVSAKSGLSWVVKTNRSRRNSVERMQKPMKFLAKWTNHFLGRRDACSASQERDFVATKTR